MWMRESVCSLRVKELAERDAPKPSRLKKEATEAISGERARG